jgi:hypothetical protein
MARKYKTIAEREREAAADREPKPIPEEDYYRFRTCPRCGVKVVCIEFHEEFGYVLDVDASGKNSLGRHTCDTSSSVFAISGGGWDSNRRRH